MQIRRLVAFLCLSCSLAGCDPSVIVDAGMDAPVDDAPRTDVPGLDVGSPVACFGTAPRCVTLMTEPECNAVTGCAFSMCAGFPVMCVRNTDESSCSRSMGCTWTGTACTGMARECAGILVAAECAAQPGCTLAARAQCRGTVRECATFTAATCSMQPGCLAAGEDGGVPLPDANCMMGAGGTTTVAIHTVTGAMGGGTMDLANVAVRAEGPCTDMAIEEMTDASGNLSLDLPNAGAPWSITLARAGHSAVSIVDVTNIAFDGDVRLDPLPTAPLAMYAASGTVTGTVAIGSTVQVDTYEFDTTTAAGGGAWSSSYYLGPPPEIAPPLTFVALELDGAGRAINFASSTPAPRTMAGISGVTIALPSTPATAIESRVVFHLPTSGLVDATGATLNTFGVEHALLDAPRTPYVFVGTETVEMGAVAGDATLVVRHFPGPLDANLTGFQVLGAFAVLNVLLTDFTDHEVTVPATDMLRLSGASLGTLEASGSGAGYDVLAIHIGEDMDSEPPHWRIYADASSGAASIPSIPSLPSTVSLADIGLSGTTTAIPLYIGMASGRIWSTVASNRSVPQYAFSCGTNYASISTDGL